MIEEEARVVAVDGDRVVIAVEKTSSCNSCSANNSCGTSSLARYFNFKPPELSIENTLQARAGDRVLVSMQDTLLMSGSFLLYIVPLLCLFAGAFLGKSLTVEADGEWLQIVSGFAGLLLGLYLVRWWSSRLPAGAAVKLVKVIQLQGRPVIFPS